MKTKEKNKLAADEPDMREGMYEHNLFLIKSRISKQALAELPKECFEGRIIVVQSEDEAIKAVEYLKGFPVLGIDSETRPSFTKGQYHKVALLQVATGECCFLFRLNRINLAGPLVKLLENPRIVKVGLSLRDDFMALRKRGGFLPGACVDIQDLVDEFGIEDKSLQKVYGILFGKKISKSQRLSNWEADVLSDAQKVYAATDAWSCYRIYKLLDELRRTKKYKVDRVVEETEEANNEYELQESLS